MVAAKLVEYINKANAIAQDILETYENAYFNTSPERKDV